MLINKKILLIEDDDAIRALYEIWLQNTGYVIVSAANGQEGIDKFKQEFFDLVLLDILLPIKDGLTVLKEMSAYNSKISVVMLTNLANEEMIQKAFDYGSVGYLLKSRLTKTDLLAEIKGFVDTQVTV